ncbi:MAG: hypothetical protein Q4A55_02715 [Aerococcus sp.]|nr:hypothetical protein [Aerococcus sp.]
MKTFVSAKLTMVTEDEATKKKGRLTLGHVSEAMNDDQEKAVLDAIAPLMKDPVIEKTETRVYSL